MGKRPVKRRNVKTTLVVESALVAELKPHPRNSRVHDERNLQAIQHSLALFGQRTPIVRWQKWVVKGCGTLEAMKRLGWRTAQVVRADELSEKEALAYAIADNKTGDLSDFHYETLADILKEIQGTVDLGATGFADFELEPLLQAEWDPGKPGAMPTDRDAESGARVVFDTAQWMELQTLLPDDSGLSVADQILSVLRPVRKTPRRRTVIQ
jgi:hypothetical protein